MNVFISYSVSDTNLVNTIATQISPFAKATYWDKNYQPGSEAWPAIFKWIDDSDLVVVVITDKTIARAFSVGQEVGHAKKASKRIIPLVAKGISSNELGCLSGTTYIPFDSQNPAAAIQILQKEVMLQRLKNQENSTAALAVCGLILFAICASD